MQDDDKFDLSADVREHLQITEGSTLEEQDAAAGRALDIALTALESIWSIADVSDGAAAKFYGALAKNALDNALGEPPIASVAPGPDGEPPEEIRLLLDYVVERVSDGAEIADIQAALSSLELVPVSDTDADGDELDDCTCAECVAAREAREAAEVDKRNLH